MKYIKLYVILGIMTFFITDLIAEGLFSLDFVSLQVSPNGKYIAVAGIDDRIRIINTKTGQEFRTIQVPAYQIMFSGTDRLYAFSNFKLNIVDIESGKVLKIFDIPKISKETYPCSYSVSLDGNIVYILQNNELAKFDLTTKELLGPFNYFGVDDISISPDGKYLLLNNDNVLFLINSSTLNLLWTLSTNIHIQKTKFSANDNTILILTTSSELLTINSITGKIISQQNLDIYDSNNISPNGQLICGWHGAIVNILTGTAIGGTPHETTCDFSSNSKIAYNELYAINIEEFERYKKIPTGFKHISKLQISNDKKSLAVVEKTDTKQDGHNDIHIKLFEIISGKEILSQTINNIKETQKDYLLPSLTTYSVSKDLAYDIRTGAKLPSHRAKDAWRINPNKSEFIISPNKKYKAKIVSEDTVVIYNNKTGKESFRSGGDGYGERSTAVYDVAFWDNSTKLFYNKGGFSLLYDIKTKQLVWLYGGAPSVPAPDEEYIISADEGNLVFVPRKQIIYNNLEYVTDEGV